MTFWTPLITDLTLGLYSVVGLSFDRSADAPTGNRRVVRPGSLDPEVGRGVVSIVRSWLSR